MKNSLYLLALLLCTTVFAQPQQLVVGVSGNGYVTRQQGGATKDNRFYLKMGGFFNESVPMGTKFHCKPTGKEPKIDWEALKQL